MRGFQGTRPDSVKVARGLRQDDTQAEHSVWRLLRDRRLTGLKFCRQHPLGKYTVDFFCYELRLAIELDGSVHSQPSQMRKDAAKDKHLERLGVRVLRIPNGMPLEDPEEFFKQIRQYALPSPAPTSRGTLSQRAQRERGTKSNRPTPQPGFRRRTPSLT
jgi:very-short-patch-repair endonuclease